MQNEFVFVYRTTIENFNSFPVKLLLCRRDVFDSNGFSRQEAEAGVMGIQPILQSGEIYQYAKSCALRTDMGKINGWYQMENLYDHSVFHVMIPEFLLIVPDKKN
jgi:ApaG protein